MTTAPARCASSTRRRKRSGGSKSSQRAGDQLGRALDVLVVGAPHEDDEPHRLGCEELGGAIHHRRPVGRDRHADNRAVIATDRGQAGPR